MDMDSAHWASLQTDERARLRAAIMHAFSCLRPMQAWGPPEDEILDHATSWLDGLYEDRILEASTTEREKGLQADGDPLPVPDTVAAPRVDPTPRPMPDDWRMS